MNPMKMSRLYAPTLKEDPTEAELASHRLLLRAGMIRKEAAGLYTYLPLAWRSIRKIENIVRDEMDTHDAQELMMPIMVDADLWRQSGRIDAYGKELVRFNDRHEREFVLGPTHEETITALVRNELRSYKQLPVNLYHIQDKFRDEFRPRYGLMRGREFIMKDAYSFSATQESLQEEYDKMKEAYANICVRCGLKALAVSEGPGDGTLTKVETPGLGTIADVAKFFGFPENGTRKALAIVDAEGNPVVAIVPGDHELNDCKAEHVFGKGYRLMTDEELEENGLFKGFIGPVNLPEGIRLVCDKSLEGSKSWTCGANEVDYHFTGACPGRDFTPDEWADLVTVVAGDPCPHCGRPLAAARGIEVSQVFQLGTKYSEAMGAYFMDEDGKEKPLIMGCYGVGVSRTLAAIVEQHNDENGIIWPVSVAPYEVSIIPLDVNDDLVWPVAEKVSAALTERGIEVIVDDRKERPGVKFADNDLMGFPYQIVCGKKAVKNGNVELKDRATGVRSEVAIDEVAEKVAQLVLTARA